MGQFDAIFCRHPVAGITANKCRSAKRKLDKLGIGNASENSVADLNVVGHVTRDDLMQVRLVLRTNAVPIVTRIRAEKKIA